MDVCDFDDGSPARMGNLQAHHDAGLELGLPEVRAKAREYLNQVDRDFITLAPPRGPWSQIQLINQRTPCRYETCSGSERWLVRCWSLLKKWCTSSIVDEAVRWWRTRRHLCFGSRRR